MMNAIELYKNKDKIILLSAIKFNDLKNIVRFTKKSNSDWAIDEDKNGLDEQEEENGIYYQRKVNIDRVKKLKIHIYSNLLNEKKKEADVLFPSSMILSMDVNFNMNESNYGIIEIELPEEKDSCLIVDGQHRMKGFIMLYDELLKSNESKKIKILEDFKFNCTILVNYDLYEQAKIFANVNFNQKPVDRSLYYDIFGEIKELDKDDDKNSLYIAHELGKYLNTSPDSPIRGFVKNYSSQKGFVSQAFLMQTILNHLGPRGTWSNVTEDYINKGQLYLKLPKVYIGYFKAIEIVFKEYWPQGLDKKDASVICKTTGLSALIKLLGLIDKNLKFGIYPNLDKLNLMEMKLEDIIKTFEKIFSKDIIKNNSKIYFGKESKFSGAGAGGLQNELFHLLADDLGISPKKNKL
jgi:DGQHR domain-containing protein